MIKNIIILIVLSTCVLLTGCSAGSRLDNKSTELLKGMNSDEFDYFFANFIMEERPIDELEPLVDASLKFHSEQAIDIIDAYIYNLSLSISKYTTVANINSGILKMEKWDQNGLLASKPKDPILKGLVESLNNRHLLLRRVLDDFLIFVDYDYVLNKYDNYLDDKTKDYYKFYVELNEYKMFTNGGIDPAILSSHMIKAQNFMTSDARITIIDDATNNYMKLLSYFLASLNEPQFLDEDQKIKQRRIESLELFKSMYPDNPLAKVVDRCLIRFEEHEGGPGDNYEEFISVLIDEHISELRLSSPTVKNSLKEKEETGNTSSLQKAIDSYESKGSLIE